MTQAPPGWYHDPAPPPPGGVPHVRYWDGATWTHHVRPLHAGPPAPSGPTTPDGERLAGWWWRALAVLVDTIVLGIVANLVTIRSQIDVQRELADLNERYLTGPADRGEAVDMSGYWDGFVAVYSDRALELLLVPMLVGLAYFAGFLWWKGATPGKLACGLRVRLRDRPGRLGWATIAVRLGVQYALPWAVMTAGLLSGSLALMILCYVGGVLFLLLDVVWAAASRTCQALHDLAARTNVVRTR